MQLKKVKASSVQMTGCVPSKCTFQLSANLLNLILLLFIQGVEMLIGLEDPLVMCAMPQGLGKQKNELVIISLFLEINALYYVSSLLTGYGGGYNERGTVEYKERVESDDEFDEFGRIKKKFRKNDVRFVDGLLNLPKLQHLYTNQNVTDAPSTSSNAPPVDEEDDDEEDDDDGDLSKYDLSGWGDESNEKTEEKKVVETPKTESSSKTSRTHHSDKYYKFYFIDQYVIC